MKYHVIASAGKVKHHILSGDRAECLAFCIDNNWIWIKPEETPGGFEWDLSIEEEDK
jgi:hypothetical protein